MSRDNEEHNGDRRYPPRVSIVLLFVFVMASFVCVRIGATAFEVTGIPWERAKFQALSAFTNAGFTTSESEHIVDHPLRRKIASYLIIFGNAGIVTVIGSFASAFVGTDLTEALINVLIIAAGLAVLTWLLRRQGIGKRLRFELSRLLMNRFNVTPTADAMLRFDRGYIISRQRLAPDSPVVGQRLLDLRLPEKQITVLAIERGEEYIAVPTGGDALQAGDALVVYGEEAQIGGAFKPAPAPAAAPA